ncbi:hypothetical protein [Mycoplasma nasistruthionis]|uniref:Lipoprotein n=1 Tax=Mycoplasma nasistruthionis TaxID=353852 RepID=A0A4Y6I6H6_9MOLU|nr:hypothetical protein [Mycoplasma nasistruthionis]QDF64982.1 hypothetical protein FIV53_01520 [Mycoplasma nasistruthionis]
MKLNRKLWLSLFSLAPVTVLAAACQSTSDNSSDSQSQDSLVKQKESKLQEAKTFLNKLANQSQLQAFVSNKKASLQEREMALANKTELLASDLQDLVNFVNVLQSEAQDAILEQLNRNSMVVNDLNNQIAEKQAQLDAKANLSNDQLSSLQSELQALKQKLSWCTNWK